MFYTELKNVPLGGIFLVQMYMGVLGLVEIGILMKRIRMRIVVRMKEHVMP